MKRFALLALVLVSGCGVKTIPPGWEGIKVNNVGARRGVEEYPIMTGRVFFNPFTEDVYQYPTSKQNYVWSAVSKEQDDKEHDESISFNSVEGTAIQADVGITFNVKPGMTPRLFITYRRDVDGLRDGVIRNEVRDALNREAGRLRVMDIIGPGKAALLDSVRSDLRTGPLGGYLDFDAVSFVHAPRPDAQVQAAINNVITAMNNATASEAKVRQSIAESEQLVAKARGDSASFVIRATGDAEANRRLNASLSEQVIRYQLANKWDGVLPQVTSGSGTPAVLFQPRDKP
jgi:regulator of protease activity HflC (stomatin/prohibitin superfamily)